MKQTYNDTQHASKISTHSARHHDLITAKHQHNYEATRQSGTSQFCKAYDRHTISKSYTLL